MIAAILDTLDRLGSLFNRVDPIEPCQRPIYRMAESGFLASVRWIEASEGSVLASKRREANRPTRPARGIVEN